MGRLTKINSIKLDTKCFSWLTDLPTIPVYETGWMRLDVLVRLVRLKIKL